MPIIYYYKYYTTSKKFVNSKTKKVVGFCLKQGDIQTKKDGQKTVFVFQK